MEKNSLRKHLLECRAALMPDEVAQASAEVCWLLEEWPVFQNAQTVLAYIGFRNEISLQTLMDAHPEKRWALPRTLPDRLDIRLYRPGKLVRHRFGMAEPAADAPLLPPDVIDLALVPGVGFDACGGRIGFGKGYYDRLLCGMDAVRVGITHAVCIVEEAPCEPHDCRMDWLVWPEKIQSTRIRPES